MKKPQIEVPLEERHGADGTRAAEFREGDEQLDRQEERIAHESNVYHVMGDRASKITKCPNLTIPAGAMLWNQAVISMLFRA